MGYNIYWIVFLFAQNDLKQWFDVFFLLQWNKNSSFSPENLNLCLCLFKEAKDSLWVFVLSGVWEKVKHSTTKVPITRLVCERR